LLNYRYDVLLDICATNIGDKRGRVTKGDVPNLSLIFFCSPNIHMANVTNWVRPLLSPLLGSQLNE